MCRIDCSLAHRQPVVARTRLHPEQSFPIPATITHVSCSSIMPSPITPTNTLFFVCDIQTKFSVSAALGRLRIVARGCLSLGLSHRWLTDCSRLDLHRHGHLRLGSCCLHCQEDARLCAHPQRPGARDGAEPEG